jgi:hypothetical protein
MILAAHRNHWVHETVMTSARVESIELSERFPSAPAPSVERSDLPRNEHILAPVDRGFAAWSFVRIHVVVLPLNTDSTQLAAAFITETIVWGVPTTFGGMHF